MFSCFQMLVIIYHWKGIGIKNTRVTIVYYPCMTFTLQWHKLVKGFAQNDKFITSTSKNIAFEIAPCGSYSVTIHVIVFYQSRHNDLHHKVGNDDFLQTYKYGRDARSS